MLSWMVGENKENEKEKDANKEKKLSRREKKEKLKIVKE